MENAIRHIEHVAHLTHAKDRDSTDSALVEVLMSLLRPDELSLIELVEWDDGWRCVMRAHLTQEMVAPDSTPPWVSPGDCPALTEHPQRYQCTQSRETLRHSEPDGSLLIVPVVTETGGTMLIEVRSRGRLDKNAQLLVEGIARIYRNFLSLLEYSERDTLTSLLNRKSFDETFYKTTQTHTQAAQPRPQDDKRLPETPRQYWLGVIDVDHFKRVNDGFGHLIGDEVLLLVARIMRSSFRHEDRLYRFGGEEFVVLLRAPDEAAANDAFERFRRNVQAYTFPQVGHITVSIGCSRIRDRDTPASAFERADQVVYQAKSQGRNQVCCFESQGHPEERGPSTQQNTVELF